MTRAVWACAIAIVEVRVAASALNVELYVVLQAIFVDVDLMGSEVVMLSFIAKE